MQRGKSFSGRGTGGRPKKLTTFLEHRLDKPWETKQYYEKLVKEGHRNLKIPRLPELNERNIIALEIYNLTKIMPIDFEKAADVMGIELSQTDRYFIFQKLISIEHTINEYYRKKMDDEKQSWR